ncbi:hypothetical protein [Nocardioides sp. SYSU D00038]|uniref:hypothetical protein n=1 Tax=Nocardioides sp. SYSU D00038 TaxID=2812554 RepID=UPI001967DCB7|nr:hypothetical protein [Nocardioides sp. SYSU D00038]
MSIVDLAPLAAPAIGALLAYWLGRGSTVRRSRTIALEDLEIYDRALAMLGPESPVVDQMREHARGSVLQYSSRRAAAERRSARRVARSSIVVVAILGGWAALAIDTDNLWAFFVLGLVAGAVGVGLETMLERVQIRLEVRRSLERRRR